MLLGYYENKWFVACSDEVNEKLIVDVVKKINEKEYKENGARGKKQIPIESTLKLKFNSNYFF